MEHYKTYSFLTKYCRNLRSFIEIPQIPKTNFSSTNIQHFVQIFCEHVMQMFLHIHSLHLDRRNIHQHQRMKIMNDCGLLVTTSCRTLKILYMFVYTYIFINMYDEGMR